MADAPVPVLEFDGSCPDCGRRTIELPAPEPELGGDFAWRARDYDTIRVTMLEELAARFPEHARWTPGDLEVVLVEALASALDQLSDMADRVTAEAYLDTARRPESVRRLLSFIGFDAAQLVGLEDDPADAPGTLTKEQKLERLWAAEPSAMERARRAGPRAVRTQRRMVTEGDYTARLEEHPLVRRAAATGRWTGSWITLDVAIVLPWPGAALDRPVPADPGVEAKVDAFHKQRGLLVPSWTAAPRPTHRAVLAPFLEAWRMAGQEVVLLDAIPAGILIDLTVEVGPTYFQSEVRRAVAHALGTRPGGFFERGRLAFGEDLYASDLFQALLRIEGVSNVCLRRFKRVGPQFEDRADKGFIELAGLEIAVCDNDPSDTSRGYWRLTLSGGRRG